MDVCKCIVPSRHGVTLNSRRAASPLVGLVAGDERPLTLPQGALPQNWGGAELNRTVTYMVLMAMVNDRRTSSPCHDEYRWPRSDYVRQQLEGFGSSGPTSPRTTRKTGSGRRKVTSARDDLHLLRMTVYNRTAFSRQLTAYWSTATGVLMLASSIRRRLLHRGLFARVPLYMIPFMANHRQLRLQWAHVHRTWKADWHQVVFSDEPRFNLWGHDGGIRVRRYAGERYLPECIIEQHSDLTPRVMVWSAISYHGRSNLLLIVGNLNSNRQVCEVLHPEVVPFL
ncbi:transposable element Tc1 transposase [Trichonephila clavipes]|nr:transposable element Tc1 transposase [Trichonephila clavipes]